MGERCECARRERGGERKRSGCRVVVMGKEGGGRGR